VTAFRCPACELGRCVRCTDGGEFFCCCDAAEAAVDVAVQQAEWDDLSEFLAKLERRGVVRAERPGRGRGSRR
jgi:hypothetical protein